MIEHKLKDSAILEEEIQYCYMGSGHELDAVGSMFEPEIKREEGETDENYRRRLWRLLSALPPVVPSNPKPVYLWRADLEDSNRPLCVTVDGQNRDVDGFAVLTSTHFETEKEAWAKIDSEARAWLKSLMKDIERLESELDNKRRELTDAARKVGPILWRDQ